MKEDITEEKIMNEVYNFIVDEKITDAERKGFINFKNRIGEKVDFSEALMALSYDLRNLAIKNISERVASKFSLVTMWSHWPFL